MYNISGMVAFDPDNCVAMVSTVVTLNEILAEMLSMLIQNETQDMMTMRIREFRIERGHIEALTWDAMFRSRRAAILAVGGGGGFHLIR